jgi:glycosyltransferase involved in cell wall biosynthesis
MKSRKKVSVCLATYNGEDFIEKQILSILPQLNSDDELIISDDYSNDSTIEKINSINDSRIKVIYNSSEKGYVSNFENALKNAHGEVIFLSDQDDIWFENKVETMMAYLENHHLVISDSNIIDNNGIELYKSFFVIRKIKRSLLGNFIKFSFLGCSFAFRSEVLKELLPFPKNRLLCTHDNWIFLYISTFFSFHIIEEPLFSYRRHSSNTSSGGVNSSTSISFKIRYRVYLILNLLIYRLRATFK